MNRVIILDIIVDTSTSEEHIFPVVLQDENEVILIDCGYPNHLSAIEEECKRAGIDMKELTKVIITHHDCDHMGALAAIKKKYPKVKIISSHEEEPYISGKEKSLRLKQAEAIYPTLDETEKGYAIQFHNFLSSIESAEVDEYVADKEVYPWCGGVEICATPGHMPGHISLYLTETKTLIAGDAIVVEEGRLAIANPSYTLDMDKTKESIRKLMGYEIERIICYHGGVYDKNDIKEALHEISETKLSF